MCGYFLRCHGLWKKGDQVLYWNSVLQYRGTWVMIRPSLISFISPLPHYGCRSNSIPTESYVQGESNGAGCKEFGQELAKDIGYYQRINYSGLIRDINAFQFWPCLCWPSYPFFKGFPSILDCFWQDLESF